MKPLIEHKAEFTIEVPVDMTSGELSILSQSVVRVAIGLAHRDELRCHEQVKEHFRRVADPAELAADWKR